MIGMQAKGVLSAVILLALTLALVPACQKKAPGPTEIGIDAGREV